MKYFTLVEIRNPNDYKPWGKKYGILQEELIETGVINWSGTNGTGFCTNVSRFDYKRVPSYEIVDDEIVVYDYSSGKYVWTGLLTV